MDQIQREKIAAKLKKIKALAERGVGGEKETAMRMYEDLKARYELEDEEIMLDAVTLHWFGYATELERRTADPDFLQGHGRHDISHLHGQIQPQEEAWLRLHRD